LRIARKAAHRGSLASARSFAKITLSTSMASKEAGSVSRKRISWIGCLLAAALLSATLASFFNVMEAKMKITSVAASMEQKVLKETSSPTCNVKQRAPLR
jgi:hypothetical protein